ncbi:MAG: energy transducer TonB [Bacteroidales bacterium]|nr:energy transducer TonB [Bacteroidales bacterium]
METKKSKKADLEKRKILFFELGLVLSLALTLTAFEIIGSREGHAFQYDWDAIPEEIETVIPTTPEKPEIPTPPAPKFGNSFELVDNHVEILDEIIPIDQMGDDYTVIIEIDDPTDEPDVPENLILDVPEVEPSFPGGDEALYSFIDKIIIYPRKAREVGIEGTVVVEFVVEPNGKLSNVTAIRKVAPSLDEEAVRVVKMLPAWNPGKQMGKAVRTRFRLPIRFQLD